MYKKKWKPSKAAINEYKEKMEEIEAFCNENNIKSSLSSDSYYFEINGQQYRVSNHSVEASNSKAYRYDELSGTREKCREEYHIGGREENVIYIHASKTRIIEIYTALKQGKKLDGRGYEKIEE